MPIHSIPASWLSLLYVPGHDIKRLEEALHSGANAVLLDLEDFVPESEKATARGLIVASAARCKAAGMGVAVRINRRIDRAVADIEHAVSADVDAIMVTKTLGAQHLILIDELVGSLELRYKRPLGRVKLIALIETSAGIGRMQEICRASSRLVGVGLGGEDIAKECSMQSSEDTLRLPKQLMIFEAVAAGVVPMGYLASVVDYRSSQEFAAMAARSKAFGFQAATCVNAEQVAVVNEVYAPTARELEHARAVVERQRVVASVEDQGSFPHEMAAALSRATTLLARCH